MTTTVILVGLLTITSYRPIPAQTRPECQGRFNCTTSTGDGVTRHGVAVSQDLLKSGRVKYGDVVYIDGFGFRVVNDCMNARITNAVDLMVFTKDEEKAVGVQQRNVYVIREKQ